MSNEAKEKIQMDPKYLLKLTMTLLITCAIVAGLLGFVNQLTLPNITAANERKTNEALTAVFEDASAPEFSEMDITDDVAAAASSFGATMENLYEAKDGGSTIGYAVKLTASGSQGLIEMVIGVDADQTVTGVSIVDNSETSGIGSKVMNNDPLPSGVGVLDQFKGMSQANGELKVGSNVDAISGATVSSKGVTKGVNGALAAVAAVMG